MDNHQLYKLVVAARKIHPMTNGQLEFLIRWYACGFGFRDVRGFDEQLNHAVDFFLEIEREWQDDIQTGRTDLSFPMFFEEKAEIEGIDLPKDFIDRITKGEEYGF